MSTIGHRLALKNIVKRYRDNVVLNGADLDIPGGALITLLGPSGCGKSTLLRVIAGLTDHSEGDVLVDEEDITSVPAHKRNVGFVFQSYALFPHMQIAQNVAFGLRMRRLNRTHISKKVSDALALVQLSDLATRYPAQLSGGQQQRAALARVLVTEPKILLLDEPFGALDRSLREHMQLELRRLQQTLGITTIVVTHDQEEALVLSDFTAVMQNGRIEQFGAPTDIYDRPKTKFIAEFIGRSNVLKGRVTDRTDASTVIQFQTGEELLIGKTNETPGADIHVMIRPENVELAMREKPMISNEKGAFFGTVSLARNLGSKLLYQVRLQDGSLFTVEQQRPEGGTTLEAGSEVVLKPRPSDCIVLGS